MVESGLVQGEGRIRATTEKLSQRVLKKGKISVSAEKIVDSGRVPRRGRNRANTEKLSGRVPKNGRISVNSGKG